VVLTDFMYEAHLSTLYWNTHKHAPRIFLYVCGWEWSAGSLATHNMCFMFGFQSYVIRIVITIRGNCNIKFLVTPFMYM
jgi:hypothetical protein